MTTLGVTARDAWIALAAVGGLGETLLPRLCAAFGGPAELLARARTTDRGRFARQLREAAECPVRISLAAAIRSAAEDPGWVQRRVAELGGWVVTPWDDTFPDTLR